MSKWLNAVIETTLIAGLLLTACSAGTSPSSKSIDEGVRKLLDLTATVKSSTDTAQAVQTAFKQAVSATNAAIVEPSLTKKLTLPGVVSVSYPGSWREKTQDWPGTFTAGPDKSIGVALVVWDNKAWGSSKDHNNDPVLALISYVSILEGNFKRPLGPVNKLTAPGLRAAAWESPANLETGGRLLMIVVYNEKADAFVQIVFFTNDSAKWEYFQPLVDGMIQTIKVE